MGTRTGQGRGLRAGLEDQETLEGVVERGGVMPLSVGGVRVVL